MATSRLSSHEPPQPRGRTRSTVGLGWVLSLFLVTSAGATTPANQATRPTPQSAQQLGRTLFADLLTQHWASAQSLFFPASAYVEMKTGQLPNPSADYHDRLLAFFTLDELAYYHYLTAGGPSRLVRVLVNPSQAQWIPAHVCENNVGYWHQPPIRLVYEQRGVVKSVAIDSLISWRGTFYVVHLGPNPRPVNIGTVDQPERGPGVPGPAGGC